MFSGFQYEDPPFFAAHLLKDLHLAWEERSWGDTIYLHLQREFNKEQSSIHIYAANSTVVRKIPYKDEQHIKDIIWKENRGKI